MASLSDISETVQQVAEAIAAVINVDVEIIDMDSIRVAGTGKSKMKIGQPLDYGVINRYAREHQEPFFVPNPGQLPQCKPCPLYQKCTYYASMIYPIVYDQKCIGAFTILSYNTEQEKKILENPERLLDFLKRMADLISSKFAEQMLLDQLMITTSELQAVFNAVSKGIVAIDQFGAIIHLNKAAQELLQLDGQAFLGKSIESISPHSPICQVLETGQGFSEKEVMMCNGKRNFRLVCRAQPILAKGQIVGAVAIFQDIKSVGSYIDKLTGHSDYSIENILGESEDIQELKKQVLRLAASSSTVLIRGESGTGKELFARAIHAESGRNDYPFVAINCAAIPEALLESELFGYEEGSFTGAKKGGKLGKLELAHGGTLFLDEIGDMPLHLQVKLLRVLEEKSFERIGSISSIKVEARFITATNRDLEEMIKRGEFREDLYYRLNVIPFVISPLRERVDDIKMLLKYFLDRANQNFHKTIHGFSAEAEIALLNYSWPGNVRELQNTVEYCAHMADTAQIEYSHLPQRMRQETILPGSHPLSVVTPLETMEKEMIVGAIKHFGKSLEGKKFAAAALGIGLTTLYRKGKKYDIPEFRE